MKKQSIKHPIIIIGRDGQKDKQLLESFYMLPMEKLPRQLNPSKSWIHDGYLYFHGPAIWNGSYYRSEIKRDYVHDVRVNKWDFPEWNDEWGKYSSHHYYYNTVVHIFREKILSQNGNVFRTKHCIINSK
jgi:hypothetical protein